MAANDTEKDIAPLTEDERTRFAKRIPRHVARAKENAAPVNAWIQELEGFILATVSPTDRALAFEAVADMVRASWPNKSEQEFSAACEAAASVATPEDAALVRGWNDDQRARALFLLSSHAADWTRELQSSDMRAALAWLRNAG